MTFKRPSQFKATLPGGHSILAIDEPKAWHLVAAILTWQLWEIIARLRYCCDLTLSDGNGESRAFRHDKLGKRAISGGAKPIAFLDCQRCSLS